MMCSWEAERLGSEVWQAGITRTQIRHGDGVGWSNRRTGSSSSSHEKQAGREAGRRSDQIKIKQA